MENVQLNRVVTIKLRNGAYFQGILIETGSNWTLLNYIPADYVVDGYVLINNNYISTMKTSDNDLFKENILKLKNINFGLLNSLNLGDTEQLIRQLESQSHLISIELKSQEKTYVGNIDTIREKSMRVHLISVLCKWLKVETFLYNELRAIYFKNDYLESLQLYNDFISKSQ